MLIKSKFHQKYIEFGVFLGANYKPATCLIKLPNQTSMDDGELELSDPALLPNTTSSSNNTLRGSGAVDSTIDEFLKHTRTCTHTHTCNPPGPDAAHTHTCYHTHAQVFSSGEDTRTQSETSSLKRRRPVGNREAVRKYREKKAAHTAYLEEEVKKLRLLNQQLVRRLQGQAAREAELLRLRALLVELRDKIDVEVSSFPFTKHCGFNTSISFKEGDCGVHSTSGNEVIGLQRQTPSPCFHSMGNRPMPIADGEGADNALFSWRGNCEPAIEDCHVHGNGVATSPDQQLEALETMVSAENQGQ